MSVRPVGLVQVGYTCRFDLVLIFVSCEKRHLLFTNSFLNLKCRNVPYNSRFVSNLAAAAQVMDNAMLIESVNIGISLLNLRLVMV